jgi:hypothetical protein
MIKGYDDYHERVQKGLPAYTHEGLINKINAQQDEIHGREEETDLYRDELTEILGMEWVGGVCPDDKKIIQAIRDQFAYTKRLEKSAYDGLFWQLFNEIEREDLQVHYHDSRLPWKTAQEKSEYADQKARESLDAIRRG